MSRQTEGVLSQNLICVRKSLPCESRRASPDYRSSSGPERAQTLRFGARRLSVCLCLGSCLRLGASSFQPHQDFGVWRTVEAYRLSSLDLMSCPPTLGFQFHTFPGKRPWVYATGDGAGRFPAMTPGSMSQPQIDHSSVFCVSAECGSPAGSSSSNCANANPPRPRLQARDSTSILLTESTAP